ncbi:MAG: ribonuclease HII [Candidatus Vogelbacteria bacterium CG10_big_fil_rev_8_21_14_0_10_45_14]|uniref:Ribonuclease n=1 Tax=Candidatus Vogelbacteria bacterium CG10_big_fil_rev_8_21_14_0_10_45_14 TaxID=1975042 RepID=A0A2H0RJ96_9BACT|nr:MAG: ribonuclease HII [Candidatus Vogelbacteria bacterium CG10_big_fil_rev_8_21_14_0_10_45_14]
MSEGKREEVYGRLCELRDAGEVLFACSLVSARVIDKVGITKAVKIALARSLQKLALCPRDCDVRLDGLLRAPSVYKKQRTIIRGDDTVSAISAASIVAKVTRDRYMRKLAKKYPDYVFQKHKGYGTKSHYDLILANGLCALHRRSYLSKIRTLA